VTLAARGALFTAAYVLLAVLPPAVAFIADPYDAPRPWWADAGVALGLIAFPVILMQFALVSRLGPASRPFGSDALLSLHRQMAVLALVFVLAHALVAVGIDWRLWVPLVAPRALTWGAAAFWGLVAIALTSFARKQLRLSYEAWRRIHLAVAVVIAGGSVGHLLLVNGYSATPSMRWLIGIYNALFLVLLLRYRLIRPLWLGRSPWVVTANADVGGRSRLLRVRPDGHRGFRFEPGQFAWLITGGSPLSAQQHPLSIASSAERSRDGALEFLIKAQGDWSGTTVPALPPGARVWVDGPFGAFTPERIDASGFVFLAGGIGIAPMRSMLLTMRDRKDTRPAILFYGAADRHRAVMADELEALRNSMALTIVFVFEEAGQEWTGERGRLNADLLRRHLPAPYAPYHYFICGPPGMIDATESLLLDALAVPAGHVHTERFQVV
jgi:predicted ferric reductase